MRVTLYVPAHAPFVVTSLDVSVNALPHASVAMATANTGTAGQLIVDVEGSGAITGASVSITCIVCEPVDALPQASVAVQVLVMLYDPAQAPFEVTSFEVSIKSLPHPSVAVAIANTGLDGQLIVVGAGSVPITGAEISWTLIVCDLVEIFPHPSIAVHVRVTLYEPVQAPLVVTSFEVNVKALPQASVAVATANTGTAGQLIVAMDGNGAITGASVSITLMVWEPVDAFPHASVAVHVLVMLYDPAQAPFVVTSFEVSVKALPHPSVAVAIANTGIEGQLIVVGAGSVPITGAEIS